MYEAATNFERWIKRPIELLLNEEHGRFALMMITLPLLERLLRGRARIGDSPVLPDGFHEETRKVFPALTSLEESRLFWRMYRHGIVHQATSSLDLGEVLRR